MKISSLSIIAGGALLSLWIGAAAAAPLKYSFSANDFNASNGTPVPQPSVQGIMTLDDTHTSILSFDMTIAGYTYDASQVAIVNDASFSVFTIGGLTNGADAIDWGTSDFFFTVDLEEEKVWGLFYSVAGINDLFWSNGEIHPAEVPEPGTLPLLSVGLLAAFEVRRRNRRN